MKLYVFLFFISSITASMTPAERSFSGTCIHDCDSIPPLNQEIIRFANSKLKKKVGSGQCWDFPAAALREVNATWNGLYEFGQVVNPVTDCIYPGDIIQFEGVLVEYEKNGGKWQESMGHHTAIIYQVNGPGNYELAHQNFGPSGKKVGITHLETKNITKGVYTVFRPVK